MSIIYLIRHGQTPENALLDGVEEEKIIRSCNFLDLTLKGEKQMRRLGEYLSKVVGLRDPRFVSSMYSRSNVATYIIAKAMGLEINCSQNYEMCSELDEIEFDRKVMYEKGEIALELLLDIAYKVEGKDIVAPLHGTLNGCILHAAKVTPAPSWLMDNGDMYPLHVEGRKIVEGKYITNEEMAKRVLETAV